MDIETVDPVKLTDQFRDILGQANNGYQNKNFDYSELISQMMVVLKESKAMLKSSRAEYDAFLLEIIRLSRLELKHLNETKIDNVIALSAAYFDKQKSELMKKGNFHGGSLFHLEDMHMTVTACYRYSELSVEKIAEKFNRAHCNVIATDKKISNYCKLYFDYREKYCDYISYLLLETATIKRGLHKNECLTALYPGNFKKGEQRACVL